MAKKSSKDENNKKDSADKKNKRDEGKSKKSSKKSGGFFSSLFGFFFKLIIVLLIVALGYYGYQYYVAYQKSGGDAEKALDSVTKKASKDLDVASEKTKQYSKVAYEKGSEWSATAYEKSEEYYKTAKEFTKESFNELSEKVKKIGEKTPEELSQSADDYLKEFMHGDEMKSNIPPRPEPTKTDESKKNIEPIKNKPIQETQAPTKEPTNQNQKLIDSKSTANKSNDPAKDGFVTAEKAPTKSTESVVKPEVTKPEETKKKGFTTSSVTVGEKNNEAIQAPPTPEKTTEVEKPTAPVKEPAHMKTYKEGREYFIQGLVHYKKQMPGSPNENVHRRQAYALFKKAAACFDKVATQMAGNEEYERISTDNHRYMFGCGKSMLVDQH